LTKKYFKSKICLQDASPGGLINLREIHILAFDTENCNMNLYPLDLIHHCRKTNIFCTSHQFSVLQSLACGFSRWFTLFFKMFASLHEIWGSDRGKY